MYSYAKRNVWLFNLPLQNVTYFSYAFSIFNSFYFFSVFFSEWMTDEVRGHWLCGWGRGRGCLLLLNFEPCKIHVLAQSQCFIWLIRQADGLRRNEVCMKSNDDSQTVLTYKSYVVSLSLVKRRPMHFRNTKRTLTHKHFNLTNDEVINTNTERLCRLTMSYADRRNISFDVQKLIAKWRNVSTIVEIILNCQTVMLNG